MREWKGKIVCTIVATRVTTSNLTVATGSSGVLMWLLLSIILLLLLR